MAETGETAGRPERRKEERVPLDGQVAGAVMVFQPMTVLDISHGGARIETEHPLHLNSLHDFRFTLGDRSVVVKGRVAHCQVGDLRDDVAIYRAGIEFVEPSEHVRKAIVGFVDTLRAAARTPPPVVDAELAGE